MKYRIAICDDEQNQIEYITSIVASWSAHEGHSCEIRTFASAEAFLFEYEEDKAYDILLLDVEMKNMNGIELAKRIRKDNNRAEIIFITSHFEFVGEGYEVDALHYLIKPISAEKLTQVLTKAAEKMQKKKKLKALNLLIRILLDLLIFLEEKYQREISCGVNRRYVKFNRQSRFG